MDISNPFRSIAPTVDADVLRVLVRTHTALTGMKVAELAGRSYAQVRSVLRRMVDDGLVDAEQHGQAYSYRWNRDHVIADAVEAIARAAEGVERRLADEAASWDPAPVAIVVFGSFARRDGGVKSDLDVLLVRSDEVAEDHERWSRQRHELARKAERWTGNRAQILELSATELSVAVERNEDLVRSLRRDGRVLYGPTINDLVGSGGIGT
jgi:predicted nucleotidyltransferase